MKINAETPVITPPQEPKQYPHLWIRSLELVAEDLETASLSATFCPYNADTQELMSEKQERFATNQLWLLIKEVPEAAEAYAAIAASVPAIRAWIKARHTS
jgi:hypothetical protein